ncbi:MAG: cytochrome b [Alphaproteobacteria bacterium]
MSGIHLRNTERGYGAVAKLFHWLIALAVIGMLIFGYIIANELRPLSSDYLELVQWHKAAGVTILGLVLVRLLWRWLNRTPALPESISSVERAGAKLTHWGFYILLIAMPVTGLLIQASFEYREDFSPWIIEWFPFLKAVPVDEGLHETFKEIHEIIAWIIVGVLALHVGAALRHHIFKKDDVLKRMLPGYRP